MNIPHARNFGAKYARTQHTGPTRAAINRSDIKGWLDVVTPYVPAIMADFLDELKSTIQPSHRKWDPDTKVWHVSDMFLEELIGMLKKYFDDVVTDLLEEPSVPDNMFMPVFEALKGLPDGTLDKVYRQLSQALHPDKGGSNELQKKLNDAYSEVKK